MAEFVLSIDESKIWLFIIWSLNLFIFTPYIIWNTVKFYRQRHDRFFSKRRPSLVIILISIILITLDIFRPTLSLNQLYKFITISSDSVFTITIFWADSTIFLLSTFLFCRAWKLFYDFKNEEHILDLKWIKIVRSHQFHIPWTIKYKYLGNVKGLIILCFVLYIIVYLTLYLIDLFTENTVYITITLCTFLTILILISIIPFVNILKIVHDYYQIHKELRYIFIIAFVILVLFVVDILPNTKIDSLIMYTLLTLLLIPLTLTMTQWVFYKKKRFLSHVDQRRAHGSIVLTQRTESLNNGNDGEQVITQQSTFTNNNDAHLHLEDVLKTEKGFKIFANHLVKELTVEHLLFLLEVMQLKHEILRYDLLTNDEIGWMIQVPSSFLKESEMYRQDTMLAAQQNDQMDDNDDDIDNDDDNLYHDGLVKPGSIRDEVVVASDDDEDDANLSKKMSFTKSRSKSKSSKRKDDKKEEEEDTLMTVFTYTDVIQDFDYLCKVYINNDAEHSLNLSSKIRKNLISQTKECMEQFKRLDKLHQMTSTRNLDLKNLDLSSHSNSPKTPRNTKSGHYNSKSIKSKSLIEEEILSSMDLRLSIRFGHVSNILESEFASFVDKEHENDNDNDEGDDIIDHKDHAHHSFHYNVQNRNVIRMRNMIENLINDLDKSLIEVYRLIERDSFSRFTDTHDYIGLEKNLYKQNNDNNNGIINNIRGSIAITR